MGRIHSNKSARDTETAAESPVFTNITGNLRARRARKSQYTVAEQHESGSQIDDFSETKCKT